MHRLPGLQLDLREGGAVFGVPGLEVGVGKGPFLALPVVPCLLLPATMPQFLCLESWRCTSLPCWG